MLVWPLRSLRTVRCPRRYEPPQRPMRSLCTSSLQLGPRPEGHGRGFPASGSQARAQDTPRLSQAVSAAEAAIRAALKGASGTPAHKKKGTPSTFVPHSPFAFPSQPPPASKNQGGPRPHPDPSSPTSRRPGHTDEHSNTQSSQDLHSLESHSVADKAKGLRRQIVLAQKQLDTLQTRLSQPASALLQRLDMPGDVLEEDESVIYHLAKRYSTMSSAELAGRPPASRWERKANSRLRRSIHEAQAAHRHHAELLHQKPVYTVVDTPEAPELAPIVYDVYRNRPQVSEVPKQPSAQTPPNVKSALDTLTPDKMGGMWANSVQARPGVVKDRMALTMTDLSPREPTTVLHGLDRVLFNPGVSFLKDPRTGMYNYDPRLQDVSFRLNVAAGEARAASATNIANEELKQLRKGTKYVADNETVADLLAHPYFNITTWRSPDFAIFGQRFKQLLAIGGFTMSARMPVQVKLLYDAQADIYHIRPSSPPAEPEREVFAALSEGVETMLVTPIDEFDKMARKQPFTPGSNRDRSRPDVRLTHAGKMAVRSTLPYHDPRLPNKTFDIRPRGVCAMGRGQREYEGAGYKVEHLVGLLNSYEREMFDLARSSMLKYLFEARLGGLDGTFVAYHNTAQVFGFEYLSQEQMAKMLVWDEDQFESIFSHSLFVLEQILDTATLHFPRQNLDLTIESQGEQNSSATCISMIVSQTEDELQKRSNEQAYRRRFGTGRDAPMCTRRTNAAFDVRLDHRTGANSSRLKGPLPLGCKFAVGIDIVARDVSEAAVACMEWQTTAIIQELRKLYVPHPDLVNERERYLETILAQNPEALRAFFHERHQRQVRTNVLNISRHNRPGRIEFAQPQSTASKLANP